MANNNLLAVVTILVMMGSSGAAQQEPSIEDLLTVEKLINGGNWRALFSYVQGNPRLTTGDGPLATELRSFVDDAKRGTLTGFDATTRNQASGGATPQTESVASIY